MDSLTLRAAPRVIGAAALFGAMLTMGVSASAAPAPEGEACVGDEGVSVVVDFTDLGGGIEVGCAEGAPDSGREALEAAGFAPEDSMPGMICAIDSQPDPCPEEFDGNFWSYWHAADGDWESYMVGADEAEPAPGDIEGWRYSTGEEGPQVLPAAVVGGQGDDAEQDPTADGTETETTGEDSATEDTATEDSAPAEDTEDPAEAATATEETEDSGGSGAGVWIAVIAGVAVVGAIIAMVVRRRGQDLGA